MKILKQFISESSNSTAPSKETLFSWIKWIKKYCTIHHCSRGNCRYYNPENNGSLCTVPSPILYVSMGKLPRGVRPQEPPENVLNILNGVNLKEIIVFR